MKRLFASIVLSVFVLGLAGCPGSNPSNPTPPAALAPGYNNQADQQMGSVLSGARAFYVSIQQQAQAGTLTLAPDVKAKFNQFGQYLNAAESTYLAYHNGTATQAQAQAQVNQVQSAQQALPLPGAK